MLSNKKNLLNENIVELISKINELEKVYEKYKKELLTIRRNELNRLNKEYLVNDYERRFGVPLDIIISAIAGEDNKNSELSKQQREQKVKYILII
jgi:hypothetical protein